MACSHSRRHLGHAGIRQQPNCSYGAHHRAEDTQHTRVSVNGYLSEQGDMGTARNVAGPSALGTVVSDILILPAMRRTLEGRCTPQSSVLLACPQDTAHADCK